MSDAQTEMMAKWAAITSAGPAHQVLDPLVGTWDQEVCFSFGPGAPPQRSKGESVIEWSLGKRFLVQRFKGLTPGSDFAGLGVSGYDNFRKEYVNVWCDSMTTAFMVTRGQYDDAGRVGVMHGTHDDAMAGARDRPHRTVTTIESIDRNTYEMFMPGPDGKEFRSLEVVSTRRTGAAAASERFGPAGLGCGGNATVYVSDMGRAIEFYSKTLGFKVSMDRRPHWSLIDAGPGLNIGLHPMSAQGPKPGAAGSISIGLWLNGPIDDAVRELTAKGVKFHAPANSDGPIKIAFFGDPDGNALYLSSFQ